MQFLYISGCTISLERDVNFQYPLILSPDGGYGNDAFFLPDNNRTITLAYNQDVHLACPGSNLVLNNSLLNEDGSLGTCTHLNFLANNLMLPFSHISCHTYPYHIARYTGNTCLNEHREIEIGFAVGSRFLRHILVCFDESNQNTLYSQFNLTSAIGGQQTGQPSPSWIQGDFFDLYSTVNSLYTRSNQRSTINQLLGLDPLSYNYIGDYTYLSRGHLTAKADFVYGAQQRLTFYYVNAAPQWQPFNSANWNYLEQDVRWFASNRSLDLIVYTGTFGVSTLPHAITNQDIELFLYVTDSAKAVPVPNLYWKVLYEPVTKSGVAFLSVNNPHRFNQIKDIICTDICSEYDWLTWSASNITLGYSYCCEVNDFRKNVTTLPDFEVVSLLK